MEKYIISSVDNIEDLEHHQELILNHLEDARKGDKEMDATIVSVVLPRSYRNSFKKRKVKED